MKKIFLCLLFVIVGSINASVFAAPVNINQASAQELAENLQGIGIKKAHAIVQYREKIGGFKSQQQLLDVKGIGASTLEKNHKNILLE